MEAEAAPREAAAAPGQPWARLRNLHWRHNRGQRWGRQQLSSIPGPGSGTGCAPGGGSGADRCGAAAATSQRGGAHRAPHLQGRRTALRRCAPPPHRLHRPAPAAPCRHRAPAGRRGGRGGVSPPYLPPQAAGAVRRSRLRLRGQPGGGVGAAAAEPVPAAAAKTRVVPVPAEVGGAGC